MFSPTGQQAQGQSFGGITSPPVSNNIISTLPLQEPIPSASQLPPSTSTPIFSVPSKHIASSQYVDAHREVIESLRKLHEHERQAWDIERKELHLKISELESSVYRLRVENGLLSPSLGVPVESKTGRSGSNSSLSPTSLSRSRSLHRDGALSNLPTSTSSSSRAPRAVSATSASRARDATSLPNIAEELEVKAPPFERKKSVQFSSIDTRSHESSSESVASLANGTKSPPMSFSPSTASAMASLPAIPGNLIDAKFDGISLKPSGLPVSVVQKVMPEAVQQVLSGSSTPLLSPRLNIQSSSGSGNGTPPPTASAPSFGTSMSRARAPSLDVYESLPPEILKEGAAYKHYAGHTPLPKFDAAGLSTTASSITSPKLDRRFSGREFGDGQGQTQDVASSVDVKGNENAETALLASSTSTLDNPQSTSTTNGFTTDTQLSSDGEGPLSPTTTMAAPTTTHPGAALSPMPTKRPSERSESYFANINGALSSHPVKGFTNTNGNEYRDRHEDKDDGDRALRGPLFLASEPDSAPPSNDAFLKALDRKLEKVAKHSPVDDEEEDEGEDGKGESEPKLRMKRSMNFGSVFGARV